ncbi:DUF1579 family protein [Mariniblastus fucicola]|uniref:PhnB-like domain-containing protein n=1 Tax=Mariniblastus fucicola TaxID=980251 RepID=A0A5B9PF66_9BACT|nr:DUF1579 family protein [Mariniblastus fucicola]QEG23820.1 hypothetical protein MFFC18_37240 [Mariniblastus fucicola]
MKIFVAIPFFVMLLTVSCVAQETKGAAEAAKSGFEFLKQFEGTWNVEAKESDSEKVSHNVVMTSRAIGSQWVVSKQVGKIGPMNFEALQTVGYDAEKELYFGSWVDSSSNYTWKLSGSVDETGTKLTLGSKGPDWNDATKKRKYRDIYEFKSETEIASVSQMMGDDGQWETFMTSKFVKQETPLTFPTKGTVTPFLMFVGKADAAIEFYKTVFPDLKVVSMNKYKAGESGKEGTVQLATIEIAGQKVMCIDSPPVHDFDFTPSFSFFVECESLEGLKKKFELLSRDGKVMMPVNNYGFSEQFGWTSDKFGVSWQLNLNSK